MKNKIEERIKSLRLRNYNYKDIILFISALIINIIIFKEFIIGHYTTDSYNLIGIGYIEYLSENFLPGGRVFSALLYYIAYCLNIQYEKIFVISLLLGLIISNIVFIKLKNICIKAKNKCSLWEIILIIIAAYYTIFNAMYLENLYFAETVVMALSILFYMLAANVFSNKKSKYILKTILFLCLGVFCYQGTISAFFAFLILFDLLKDKKTIKIFENMFLAGLLTILAILINMLQIRFSCAALQVQQGRLQFDVINNFILGLKQVINIFMNTFYKGFYIQIIAITFILTMIYVFRRSKNDMQFWSIILIVIICLGAAIIPTISGTSAIGAARIRFSVGACVGLIYLFLITKTDIFINNKIISVLLISILIIYGVFNTHSYILNINISKKIDIKDIQEAKKVIEYVEHYEKENNIKVENISIYVDYNKSYKGVYKNLITDYSAMNWSALRTRWSSKEIIEYCGNRQFESKEITEEEMEKYLEQVDNRDYLIMDNTFYITCFIN